MGGAGNREEIKTYVIKDMRENHLRRCAIAKKPMRTARLKNVMNGQA